METVKILRDLWRLRLLVLVVGLLAVLVAVAVSYRLPSFESRKYEVGVATARIFVDTPKSQVIDVAPKGSEALGIRASLIASLMVEGELLGRIAQRAGLKPDQLEGIAAAAAAETGPPATPPDPRGYVLTTSVLGSDDGEQLPIIQLEAQAPNAAAAAKLADAAISAMPDYLDSKAAAEQVPDSERLRVSGLGAAQSRQEVRGPRLMVAIIAALFIFIAGCAAMLGFFALARAWRAASTKAHFGGGDLAAHRATVERLFDAEHDGSDESVSELARRRATRA